MTQYKTAAVASLSVMTLTTMFLTSLNAKERSSNDDRAGTVFSIMVWITAFIIHQVCQGEEIFAQLLTVEFVALNIGVGFQMFFAGRPGGMVDWLLNSSWLMYAIMGIVTFYSDDESGTQSQLGSEAIVLDLKEVEHRLERIQARLDRLKTAANKVD